MLRKTMQKAWKIISKCILNGAQNRSDNQKYVKQMHADNRRWILMSPRGGTTDRLELILNYSRVPEQSEQIGLPRDKWRRGGQTF